MMKAAKMADRVFAALRSAFRSCNFFLGFFLAAGLVGAGLVAVVEVVPVVVVEGAAFVCWAREIFWALSGMRMSGGFERLEGGGSAGVVRFWSCG